MNPTKLLFSLTSIVSVGLVGAASLLYQEYKQLGELQSFATIVGHEVIDIRDTIALLAIDRESDPYPLNQVLVDIELEAKKIEERFVKPAQIWRFNEDSQLVVQRFTDSLNTATDTLDHVVGIVVVERSLLSAVNYQLTQNSTELDEFQQSLLLENIAALSKTNQLQEANLKTLATIQQQKHNLFTQMLSHEFIGFVEETEHQLTDITTNMRTLLTQLLIAFLAVMTTTILGIYLLRVKELERNNKSYQDAIDRTERANEAKSIFLATMSHELRTPMNGVLGIAQVIEDESSEKHVREHAQTIISSGQHLVTILNDILDFSKVEQGKMALENKPFALSEVTESLFHSLTTLANEKGIEFEISSTLPDNTTVVGDSSRLRQVLFNLAGNAIKFTNEGRVDIAVSPMSSGQGLQFVVSDSGIGMAQEKIASIFQPFEQAELSTTRRFGGTGLGLSIVKQITDLMGGEIKVFSKLGVGSQFTLIVPLTFETAEPLPTIATGDISQIESTDQRSIQILLVDDNRVNAAVARRFLANYGHKVTLAEDGSEAVDILKEQRFNLIIMDNHMPNLGGIETIKIIRQELKIDTVIFGYTADVFQEAHDDFIDAGADFVLTKPLQKASLEQAILQFFQQIHRDHRPHVQSDNVVSLVRYPVSELPMTEEEITHSSLMVEMALTDDEKLDILQSLSFELSDKVEKLFAAYSDGDITTLRSVIHSIKGTGLEFGMQHLVECAKESERLPLKGEMPNLDALQQLLNRILVNSHQAKRLIEEIKNKRETG